MCRENFKDIICCHNENVHSSDDDMFDEQDNSDTFTSKIAITFLVTVILMYLSFFIWFGIYGIYVHMKSI